MKIFYKRTDLTELEYNNLLKCIDFNKWKEVEKQYEDYEFFKGFNIIEKLNNPKNIEYSSYIKTSIF